MGFTSIWFMSQTLCNFAISLTVFSLSFHDRNWSITRFEKFSDVSIYFAPLIYHFLHHRIPRFPFCIYFPRLLYPLANSHPCLTRVNWGL